MTGILDRVARSLTFMRPEMISDVFAIEIARRLEDVPSLHRYQRYTRKLPLRVILEAFRSVAELRDAHERSESMKRVCDAALSGEAAYV